MNEDDIIKPQPGPQEAFLSTKADLAFYGGAAGGGKSFALLLDPLRHEENSKFRGVIFRREIPMITNPGALWDESAGLYTLFGGEPNQNQLRWRFPSGMEVKLSHLFQEKDKFNWQGAQFSYLGFDEVTHFSETQFFYLLSRLRSMSGVPGYARATCNPDPDSWVAKFIEWWINQETGLAYPDRAGVLRWFIRVEDEIVWADDVEELTYLYGEEFLRLNPPTSVTFIPAKLSDNQILLQRDPSYLARLNSMSRVDRARLKDGNWKVKASAGSMFQKAWFEIVETAPARIKRRIRYWDRAATEPSPTNQNPDWTAGVKVSQGMDGCFYIEHVERFRGRPLKVQTTVKNLALQDGVGCSVGVEVDPGQAGITDRDLYIQLLAGFDVKTPRAVSDKVSRAKGASAQAEGGNIKLVKGAWNEAFLNELEAFPTPGAKDDQVDGLSGAINDLALSGTGEFSESMTNFEGNIENRW